MKETGFKNKLHYWSDTILFSYSQLFFAMNKPFAFMIFAASLISLKIGLGGFFAVVLINAIAYMFNLDKEKIRSGVFGYNALLLGMALINEYCCNLAIVTLFAFSVLFLLLVSTLLQGFLEKYGLPYLSLPFLLTWSIVRLAAGSFSTLELSQDQIFHINQILLQQNILTLWITKIDWMITNEFLRIYLQTLSSILFQGSVVSGLLISVGLFYYSRIFFSLSLLGFFSAYGFFIYFGADLQTLTYFLGGSNFIFMALAVGAYYVVANKYSYAAVVFLVPITVFLHISLGKLFQVFQLQTFTLAFSMVVVFFLLFLYQRKKQSFLHLVQVPLENPEAQVYHHHVQNLHYRRQAISAFHLPFYGSWKVSQGYEGGITHLGSWSNALDFVIEDSEQKTYAGTGTELTDFYCYNKPVLAPDYAYVYDIVNTVEENPVGGVNTEKNWGNTIVLNHLNGVFSQISHLKKDSIQVRIGDYVTRGTLLATCGNSGRSPEPHIHFQIQHSPEIGAATVPFPFRYFIEEKNKLRILKVFEVPSEGTLISAIDENPALQKAFDFVPGKKLIWVEEGKNTLIEWEVYTNAFNQKYILCKSTGAIAWLINDGTMLYFTGFTGNKKSLLYQFYLAAYRVFLSTERIAPLEDVLPLSNVVQGPARWFQDLLIPFVQFHQVKHSCKTSAQTDGALLIQSELKHQIGVYLKKNQFSIFIRNEKIEWFECNTKRYRLCVFS